MKRKEWKARARRSLRRHYAILVLSCLIAAFLGVEFTGSLGAFQAGGARHSQRVVETGTTRASLGVESVWDLLAQGDEQAGRDTADLLESQQRNEADPVRFGLELGRQRGVLAQVANVISSGSVLVTLWSGISAIVGSPTVTTAIFVLLTLAVTLFFSIFVFQIYRAVCRRVFLEARIYEKVPIRRFLFFLRVKKWMRASLTLLLSSLRELLWWLTLVGGPVKHYAYSQVPYLVAENPALTARQALRLSNEMMQGHKWERFLLDLSFLGWSALEAVTLGLSGLFYSSPYRVAVCCEFYADVRAQAIARQAPGWELLNDRYLFERADAALLRRTYPAAAAAGSLPPVQRPGGLRGFFANTLGIALANDAVERAYEQSLEQNTRYAQELLILRGSVYPGRLFPIPERQRRSHLAQVHYMRHYSIVSLILLFFAFSFVGWLWEVMLHVVSDGVFVNRGVLHGPWLPIYGAGSILILLVLNRLRGKPVAEFFAAIVLCGVVEYATSWLLEVTQNGMKWWDYSGYFLNLNGRICAEGLLAFGLGGMAVVYAAAPLLDNLIRRLPRRVLLPAALCLSLVFCTDALYSARRPNTGAGVTDYASGAAGRCLVEFTCRDDLKC